MDCNPQQVPFGARNVWCVLARPSRQSLAKAELAQRIAAGSFVLERPAERDISRDSEP